MSQDIALLRAAGYDIISTNRGYILNSLGQVERVFKVRHTNEQMEEELNAIVDMGGCVKDVAVNHRIYGRMEAELNISSRRKIALFLEDIKTWKLQPSEQYHVRLPLPHSQRGQPGDSGRHRGNAPPERVLVEERKEDSGINKRD